MGSRRTVDGTAQRKGKSGFLRKRRKSGKLVKGTQPRKGKPVRPCLLHGDDEAKETALLQYEKELIAYAALTMGSHRTVNDTAPRKGTSDFLREIRKWVKPRKRKPKPVRPCLLHGDDEAKEAALLQYEKELRAYAASIDANKWHPYHDLLWVVNQRSTVTHNIEERCELVHMYENYGELCVSSDKVLNADARKRMAAERAERNKGEPNRPCSPKSTARRCPAADRRSGEMQADFDEWFKDNEADPAMAEASPAGVEKKTAPTTLNDRGSAIEIESLSPQGQCAMQRIFAKIPNNDEFVLSWHESYLSLEENERIRGAPHRVAFRKNKRVDNDCWGKRVVDPMQNDYVRCLTDAQMVSHCLGLVDIETGEIGVKNVCNRGFYEGVDYFYFDLYPLYYMITQDELVDIVNVALSAFDMSIVLPKPERRAGI